MTGFRERKKWLDSAVKYHGHICLGQVFGVLISELGLKLIKTRDPHDMIVISENDRCIADALQIITGTRLGRRSFKLKDCGKMAATFCNLKTGRAFRVWVKGNAFANKDYFAMSENEKKKFLDSALRSEMSDVLEYMHVKVRFSPHELPGKPKIRVNCEKCGERVMDGKHSVVKGKNLCRSCAEGPYYKKVSE
jgi:formylmethanofuran dehydrogenase subunit E